MIPEDHNHKGGGGHEKKLCQTEGAQEENDYSQDRLSMGASKDQYFVINFLIVVMKTLSL